MEPAVLSFISVSVDYFIRKKSLFKIKHILDPIVCDCNIAWLIRDNRHLRPSILGGTCSNSTPFEDLNPGEYLDCDLTPTESPSSSTTEDNSAYRFGPTIFYFLLLCITFLY